MGVGINREALDKMIHTEQDVVIGIGAETFAFRGWVAYDSLRNPPHRLMVDDRKGNVVFLMLKEK